MFPSVKDLHYIAQNIEKSLKNKRVSSLEIISGDSFVISFEDFKESKKDRLIINFNNQFPYISLFPYSFKKAVAVNPFCSKLGNIVSGLFLDNIKVLNNDRILVLKFVKENEPREGKEYSLCIELFPYHPNIVLCDSNNSIIAQLKKSYVDRIYKPSIKIRDLDDETAPFNMADYLNRIDRENRLISQENESNLMGKAFRVLSAENKKMEKKISNLDNDLAMANKESGLLDVADELSSDRERYQSATNIALNGVVHNLDQSLSINENIENFYRRYKKSKIAILEINKQIQIAKQKLLSNNDLLISLNSMSDDELNFICGKVTNSSVKKNDNCKISHYYYEINDNGIKYSFGKNSLQNETVSFLLATRNNYWFHIKNTHGSHLIIRQEKRPSDDCIRTACELIILLNKKLDGEVTFTKRTNVRKGHSPGQVFIKNYETIQIKRIDDRTRELLSIAEKKSI
ncbi:MAG: NFACT family protein [Bacilli bacterium]|jgi:predicted ribosome quality control (RQC) complex YloA/Tae2 family protein